MILKCQLCQDKPPVSSERFCTACKKIVIDKAKADGKVRENPRTTFSEERGRKLLRTWAEIGGAPTIPEND